MTNEEARRVLEGMGATIHPDGELIGGGKTGMLAYEFKAESITGLSYWGETADMSGHFTAGQLEAIAMWMRDPKGVMGE